MPGTRRCRWPCRRLKMCLKSLGLLWVLWSEDLTPHMHTRRLPAASVRLLMGPPLAGFQDTCDKCIERSGNELGHTFSAPSSFFFTPTALHTHTQTALTPNPSHRPCVSFSFFTMMRLSSACSLFMKSECKLGCVETDGNHSPTLTQMHIFIKPSQRCNASFKVEFQTNCIWDSYISKLPWPCGSGRLVLLLVSHLSSYLNEKIIFRKW